MASIPKFGVFRDAVNSRVALMYDQVRRLSVNATGVDIVGNANVSGTLSAGAVLNAGTYTGDLAITGALTAASLKMAAAGHWSLGTAESVTIVTGVATVTRPLVNLIGEGATTDTLDSITYAGQAAGDLLLIQCSGAYTITFDNSATLILGAGTRAMAAGSTMLLVATSATVWREVTFLTAAS